MVKAAVSGMYALRNALLRSRFFTSTVLPAIPRRMRWALRKLYFLPASAADRFLARGSEMVPPKSKIFTGSVDGFVSSGQMVVRRLVGFGGLTPDSRVLDVGSGIGRLAVPLTEYLRVGGSYEGLDIVEDGIRWCTDHITPKHPNFRFRLADVYNKEYNPQGRVHASEYRFPYPSESFDVVVLISVFTHVLPADFEQYLSEIARVLATGGRCLATFYLINGESRSLMERPGSTLRFKYHVPPYWTVNPSMPELSVGYDESYVRSAFAERGLAIGGQGGVLYGGWCGRAPLWSQESGLGDQDVVVAAKR